jgi:uncharacterized membrane protein
VEGGDKHESVGFARIVAFTDGVFAIAITLLVLSLDVPSDLQGSELKDYLADSWPQLFSYFLSFAVIGRYWLGHHQLFEMLGDFDRGLMAINLAYLSLIVLVPFPTELLGEYGGLASAVIPYAAVLGTASLLSWAMLRYALHRGHVKPGERVEAVRVRGASLQPAIVFYASIAVALVSPQAAQFVWLGLLLGGRPPFKT